MFVVLIIIIFGKSEAEMGRKRQAELDEKGGSARPNIDERKAL